MASIAVNGVCSGGDHVRLTVTTTGGTFQTTVSKQEVRQTLDDVGKREFVLRQVAAIIRDNPSATPQQLKTIVESRTYLE